MSFLDWVFGGNLSMSDAHIIELAVEDGVRKAKSDNMARPASEQQFIADTNRVRYEINKLFDQPERDPLKNLSALTASQRDHITETIRRLAEEGRIQQRSAKIIIGRVRKLRSL